MTHGLRTRLECFEASNGNEGLFVRRMVGRIPEVNWRQWQVSWGRGQYAGSGVQMTALPRDKCLLPVPELAIRIGVLWARMEDRDRGRGAAIDWRVGTPLLGSGGTPEEGAGGVLHCCYFPHV